MLKVNTRNMGHVVFLCLQGHIVTGQTANLRDIVISTLRENSMLRNAETARTNALVLDLSQVSTVDAGGLGVLLELRAQVQSTGIGFKLMNVNRLIGMVLKITRLDTVFDVTSSVEFFPAISERSAESRFELASCA